MLTIKQRTDNQAVQRLRPLYPLWILEGVGQYHSNTKQMNTCPIYDGNNDIQQSHGVACTGKYRKLYTEAMITIRRVKE